MSIRADILQAKYDYERHLFDHKCSTLVPCPGRLEKWQEWMTTAEMWGREPDDDRRQRDHYNRTNKTAA